MFRHACRVTLLAFVALAPACGSGGSNDDGPDLGGEWWLTTIASSASDGFVPSTSWGTATLSTDGDLDTFAQANLNCASSIAAPGLDTGSTYSVNAAREVTVSTASGELGFGQVSTDLNFMTVGLASVGSSPTLACLLRKEGVHSAASMAGEWSLLVLEECNGNLTSCVGAVTFDAVNGTYGYDVDCNIGTTLAEDAIDDGTFTVGADGALTLTGDLAGMGGVAAGGTIAISAGDHTGGNNTFVVMIRTSGTYQDSDFNGDYRVVTYEHRPDPLTPSHQSFVGILSPNGISAMGIAGTDNEDGVTMAGSEPTGNTFNVLSDGTLEVDTSGGDLVRGALTTGATVGIVGGPLTDGARPLGGVLIRK